MKEQITILAASNNPGCLGNIGLYTIMLAKRAGMRACLLFVLQEGNEGGGGNQGEMNKTIQEKARSIQHAGAKANVRIDCLITTGHFAEEVARYLRIFDSPILVVDEGACGMMRKKELRIVEKMLRARGEMHSGRFHHFLVISEKCRPGAPGKQTPIIDLINTNQFLKE